ncbi:PAAR domain-containing protein [Hymenobacter cheonanensis]|uniref:PAAR domain-containing protein n=1 Tax=Hymenobacter sp. CA2-7 TaxID=3063993 RepID=UPI0027141D4F|nr:PAAR domain-containing protein [Hymenobacter sp. CA2-7]MDO7883970.1 PAAR domain-containing protein [Hymenobacter sp. CA2-7]
MPPAARVGDLHICPLETPGPVPIPHVGGPILGPGVPTVLIGGLPAAVADNEAFCLAPEPDMLEQGSLTVWIGGLPAARMGDATAHGGEIVMGLPTVLIGG